MSTTANDVTPSTSKAASPASLSPFTRSLLAGALAGTTVDLSLYPLDTIKTRLQSSAGFAASGGFRGVYAGVGSAVVGSAPGAALFFVTYESTKSWLARLRKGDTASTNGTSRNTINAGEQQEAAAVDHMLAASLGELAACTVRVPTEVIKQRAQAAQHPTSLSALTHILRSGSPAVVVRNLYRGFGITLFREVPFTVIQFPLWEGMKKWTLSARRRNQTDTLGSGSGSEAGSVRVTGLESALFGSISGAVAAALTTPLDVLKTRMMLSKQRTTVWVLANQMVRQESWRVFFKGVGPRIGWISLGGAVFLGSYQWAANMLGG